MINEMNLFVHFAPAIVVVVVLFIFYRKYTASREIEVVKTMKKVCVLYQKELRKNIINGDTTFISIKNNHNYCEQILEIIELISKKELGNISQKEFKDGFDEIFDKKGHIKKKEACV